MPMVRVSNGGTHSVEDVLYSGSAIRSATLGTDFKIGKTYWLIVTDMWGFQPTLSGATRSDLLKSIETGARSSEKGITLLYTFVPTATTVTVSTSSTTGSSMIVLD